MAFLSTEEVIEALDKDEPALGSKVDCLSLRSFEADSCMVIGREEEQPSTVSQEEHELLRTAGDDSGQMETDQVYINREGPSQEEDEQPHAPSEDPGQDSAGEGPSRGGTYIPSEESSEEESSQDEPNGDEEAPKKKTTQRRKRKPNLWQKN